MHIEDRLSYIESSIQGLKTSITEFSSKVDKEFKRLDNARFIQGKDLSDAVDLIHRLEKRLESTEAQIRKLFALNDELVNGKKSNNEVKQEATCDNSVPPIITAYQTDIFRVDLKCNKCQCTNWYTMSDGHRAIRLQNGNIAEIIYQFRCAHCLSPILIRF